MAPPILGSDRRPLRPFCARIDAASYRIIRTQLGSVSESLQPGGVGDFYAAPRQVQDTPLLACPQDPIGSRARRAGELGDIVLCERDHDRCCVAEQLHQVDQPEPDAMLDWDIERFDQGRRQAPHFCNQSVHHKLVDLRPTCSERLEVVSMQAQGLTTIEGDGTATARARRQQRQLTEEIAGAEHPNHCLVTQGCGDPNPEMAGRNHMERVCGIAVVEHNFVAPEPATPGGRQYFSLLIVVEHVQQPRQHGTEYRTLSVPYGVPSVDTVEIPQGERRDDA